MMHRLKHRNIVELFGYGSMPNGDHFIVMELMDGGSIDRGLTRKVDEYIQIIWFSNSQ
jgi:serine/threonine protein kinase